MGNRIIILALFLANLSALIFTSCAIIENVFPPKINVLVWEDLENGFDGLYQKGNGYGFIDYLLLDKQKK